LLFQSSPLDSTMDRHKCFIATPDCTLNRRWYSNYHCQIICWPVVVISSSPLVRCPDQRKCKNNTDGW
jgi:hypothetical protein